MKRFYFNSSAFSHGKKCFVRPLTISSAHQAEFVRLVQGLELNEGDGWFA